MRSVGEWEKMCWKVKVRNRALCHMVLRAWPREQRKLLTSQKSHHCGTVPVMTGLRRAEGFCKVLTLMPQSCLNYFRLNHRITSSSRSIHHACFLSELTMLT